MQWGNKNLSVCHRILLYFSSEYLPSDDSLGTLSVESSVSGISQIPTKPVMSSNKSSTFRPRCHQITCQKHRRMTHLIYVQGKIQQSTWHNTLKWILNWMNLVLICFLWWRLHNGHNLGYDYFCLPFVSVYYQLMLHGTIFFLLFISGNCIGILFWENGAGHRRNGCNFFIILCNG